MDHATAERFYADFAKAFNSGDMQGLLDLYEPEAVFVRGPSDHVSGQDALRVELQGFLDTKGKISFKVRHVVRHGDIALLSNEYTLEGKDLEGKPFTMSGKTSEDLRRQSEGRWLLSLTILLVQRVEPCNSCSFCSTLHLVKSRSDHKSLRRLKKFGNSEFVELITPVHYLARLRVRYESMRRY